MKTLILVLALLMAVPALAGDVITAGANNSSNTMQGPLTYTRQQCYDGSTWDTLVEYCLLPVDFDTGAGTDYHSAVGLVIAGSGGHTLVSATAPLPVSATGAPNTAAVPLYVQTTNGTTANASATPEYVSSIPLVFAGNLPANCVAITAGSVQFTFAASTYYKICALGNTAYVLTGANPTATTTAVTGYDFFVAEGSCAGPYKFSGAKAAVIGGSAAGVLCFQALTAP